MLSKEEQDILDSYNHDEWRPVANIETEMQQYRTYAAEALRQQTSIPVRLNERDLDAIRRRAQVVGVPYQKFIADILHEFVTSNALD